MLRAIVESAGPAGWAHDAGVCVIATPLIDDARRLIRAQGKAPMDPTPHRLANAIATAVVDHVGRELHLPIPTNGSIQASAAVLVQRLLITED